MSQAEALELLKRGVALAKAGDRAAARPLVRRAVVQDPTCESAWMWLAGLAETPREALGVLERVLELNPLNERARAAAHTARLQAGVAAAKSQQKGPARVWLRAVVAAEPGNELAWMWLASVAEAPAEAASCLEKALALNPANERACAGLENIRAACRPRPTPPTAKPPAPPPPVWCCPLCRVESEQEPQRCRVCRALLRLDDPDAFTHLEGVDDDRVLAALRLLKAKPGQPDFDGRRLLGITYLNLKQFDAAEAEFRGALEFRPGDREVRAVLEALARWRVAEAAREAELRPRKIILTVDDSPTICKLVTMTLERRGYEVWTAGDAAQAVSVLREQGVPNLILLDINMPGMDGYQLCRLLRQDRETARIPIVMLSGKDGIFNKMRGRLAGSTSYITKPFEPDRLLRVLQRYCPLEEPAGK